MFIKNIIVFGGGTSGWLTATYLCRKLRVPVNVTLIEDTSIGPIGVGEGTQPATARFLHECGIPPKEWMKDSKATFKLGVEMIGWTKENYFVDNDTYLHHTISDNLNTANMWSNLSFVPVKNPSYTMARALRSPKMGEGLDFNNPLPEGSYGSVHFSALDIVQTLKRHILNDIIYVDTKIEHISSEDGKVTGLVGANGVEYKADLYIDCTGFKSILLEQLLGVPFESFNDFLPCDRAIAIPTQYSAPTSECHPCTKATAMSAGWRWTIPTFERIGNGYVYSSNYISDEDAENELRNAIGEFEAPALKLRMKCGRHKSVVSGNVYAVGLSAGFIEPLEATGITFTTAMVKALVNALNMHGNALSVPVINYLESVYTTMMDDVTAFVFAHYQFSTKRDTTFWKDCVGTAQAPTHIQSIIDKHIVPPRYMFDNEHSMFNTCHWYTVISNGKTLPATPITFEEREYGNWWLKIQDEKIRWASKMFPNHYLYLKDWYDGL